METISVATTTHDLPELTDVELADVVGGNDTLDAAYVEVNRRIGMCGCGVAH